MIRQMEETPTQKRKTVVLIVLDGFGLGPNDNSNPIYAAHGQNLKMLMENYPTASLQASGIAVGLPWGETGNSEVGHLTMGAGRVIYQHFPRITLAVQDGTLAENPVLKECCAHAKKNNGAINFVGLITKTPTHAFVDHLRALIEIAKKEGVEKINLHLFADGKDSPPGTLSETLKGIPQELIANIMGRYYGMDREGNWQLTQMAYDALTKEELELTSDLGAAIRENSEKNKTEELLPPLRLKQESAIKDGDSLFFFNFREDSIRQIAESFIEKNFNRFPVKSFSNLFIATITRYKETFDIPIAFPPEKIDHPLAAVISESGKIQLRVAETYKYAHVTYFFNAFKEEPYGNEYRVLVPSLQVASPAEHPQLSASAITDRLIQSIENQSFDFVLVNYANGDTIGHTGNYQAAVETVKVLDAELGRVIKSIESAPADTILCITSDHGNIERVFDPITGRPDTSHDPNPVPFILVAKEVKGRKFLGGENIRNTTIGSLADVAPTILEIMELPKPKEMTGESLLKSLL